jgi:hypothetical protein
VATFAATPFAKSVPVVMTDECLNARKIADVRAKGSAQASLNSQERVLEIVLDCNCCCAVLGPLNRQTLGKIMGPEHGDRAFEPFALSDERWPAVGGRKLLLTWRSKVRGKLSIIHKVTELFGKYENPCSGLMQAPA